MTEVMKHLRALVFEKRIKENWSHYLPLAQRIINNSVDGSVGTQPARVIFGDIVNCDLALESPRTWEGRNLLDYLVKLRNGQARLIKVTQEFLSKNRRKRTIDGGEKANKVVEFHVGNYVLLQYPNRPPNMLAGLYRSPLIIVAIERLDIITVKDLISNKVMKVHTSRLRLFHHLADMTRYEISALAAGS